MAMSAVSTVRTIAQSLGKGSAQPQGRAKLHPQALVHKSEDRGMVVVKIVNLQVRVSK